MKKNQKSTNKVSIVAVNAPTISRRSKAYLKETVESGWISSSGPMVTRFEESFATYLKTKEAVSVANGTAALHVALLALGIGKGDEVIVPAFTMAATWFAVFYIGAKPVFVDCELRTYNIDTSKIEEKITKYTKAIIAVHIYGLSCDMDEINRIAKKHSIPVVEDAAEAHGALYKGRKCGTLGVIGCFSFYANKIITTGEGGMIVTSNKVLAARARRFRDLCHSVDKRFIHDDLGYNYRFTSMQAAIGLGELEEINHNLAKKQRMAEYYNRNLKGIPGITLPPRLADRTNVYWMYAILIDKKLFGIDRDSLRRKLLKDYGIDTRDFFYSPNKQPILKGILNKGDKFPVSDFISRNGLYLPSGLAITKVEMERVVNALKSIAKSY